MTTWLHGSVPLTTALVAITLGCGAEDEETEAQRAATLCPLEVGSDTARPALCGHPPLCTSYAYSEWSHCTGTGVQTRTVVAGYPTGCYGGLTPLTSQSCTSYDIGVIPSTSGTCPAWEGQEEMWIYLDDEDSCANGKGWVDCSTGTCTLQSSWVYTNAYPDSQYSAGWIGATTQNRNTTLRFCRVDGSRFVPHNTTPDPGIEYAVLKLGTQCPNGSIEFRRDFDTEDDNNANDSGGNIAPNTWDGNYAHLYFCLFRYGPVIVDPVTNLPGFPNLGMSYGVFAPAINREIEDANQGWIKIDDENDYNNDGYWVSDPYSTESAERIIYGDHDTWMLFGRVSYQ